MQRFYILELEKLALFNLVYFCHSPIKPKFPLPKLPDIRYMQQRHIQKVGCRDVNVTKHKILLCFFVYEHYMYHTLTVWW